ncbi:MAG: hypothetical protein LBL21_01785 [Rickettsiales bacterium]|jgi:hypothetical protein|nr:hypothetical protein [Rickettsiales bacterium]
MRKIGLIFVVFAGAVGIARAKTINITSNITQNICGNSILSTGQCGGVVEKPSGNTVNLYTNGLNLNGKTIYGGNSGSATATVSNNTVNINAANLTSAGSRIFGAYASTGVSYNTVNIGDRVNSAFDSVIGGASDKGATRNSVHILGGSIANVIGGQSSGTYAASNNSVRVTGGSHNDITGGYTANGSASNNYVYIGGNAVITGLVDGGYSSGTGLVSWNTVELAGNADLSAAIVRGGYSSGNAESNNTLILNGAFDVDTIYGFQNYEFRISDASATALNVTNAGYYVDLTGAKIKLVLGDQNAAVGDSASLIHSAGGFNGTSFSQTGSASMGLLRVLDYDISTNANTVAAVFTGERLSAGAPAFASSRRAALADAAAMSSMAVDGGLALAAAVLKDGERKHGVFADAKRINESFGDKQSVSASGWAFMGGYAREYGDILLSGFGQALLGEYNTDDDSGIRSSGAANAYGAGFGAMIGKNGNWKHSGTIGIGMTGGDFAAKNTPLPAEYDEGALYVGLDAKSLYRWKINDGHNLDIFAKLMWTRLAGEEVELPTGERIDFDASHSVRSIFGMEYHSDVYYYGAKLDYEFAGGQSATALGKYDFSAESVSGLTYALGVGIEAERNGWLLRVGLELNLGARRGLDFGAGLARIF